MVYQVPMPEPLRWLEPSEKETRTLHALEEYGIMSIKLYEDIMRHGDIATGFDYPVKVNGRYIMSPSPIPRFDNPKMHQCPALQLFGAGREKRIYAIPPYTDVVSLDFEDYPFTPQSWDQCCAICGATDTYLDEIVMEEVLSEIRDIAKRDGISCTCGSKKWTFQVNYSSVDLICTQCGAQVRIPAATADDIDDICCKTNIVIRGKQDT